MGTPKKKQKVWGGLKPPAIAKKIQLLKFGMETGKGLKIEMLPNVLDEIIEIIIPLVSWLDKPIFSEAALVDYSVPKAFKRKRGVHLFELRIMDIWLERSGKWFLHFYNTQHSNPTFKEVNSQQLAKIMFQKSDDFLSESSSMLKELPFLKNIALYNIVFLQFLSQCFKSVKALIEEREKRLRIMREWMDLLHEFSQSLDPLVIQDKKIIINEYSIFRDTEHGSSRCTANYFCSEVLEPFWKMLKSRSDCSKYKEFVSEYHPESLKDILQRLGWIFDEIKKTDMDADAKSLFGYSSGRLPFIEKEITVLKEIVDSITEKD